jgi:pimeloyl-ACP methyl ester carboxylesterase
MPNVTANGIQIEYETFGESTSPALLLISGFSEQMIQWPSQFCEGLSKKGLYVIRFDNRDTGLSSKFFEKAGGEKIIEKIEAYQRGEPVEPPYTTNDMADDAIGLLDALHIEKAHICGISMGGRIAQTMAINSPTRIMSLISIASSTGESGLPQGTDEARKAVQTLPPPDREEYIKHSCDVFEALRGPFREGDMELARQLGELSFDRCYYPQGRACHALAGWTAGSRKEELKSVTVPTLVIHGEHDPIAPLEHGKATVEAIPNAKLMIVKDMWHIPVPAHYPEIIEAIIEHTDKAQPY